MAALGIVYGDIGTSPLYAIHAVFANDRHPVVPVNPGNILGVPCDPANTTFFLGRETLVPTKGAPMAIWRQKLFVALFRNASSPTAYFGLPPGRVVELGAQVNL